jgi:pimeloyl-ACP methyl ester carboxylesterase
VAAESPIFAVPIPSEPARVVGPYRLERMLGRGGMGEVWLGRHVGTGGLAAVKLLRPQDEELRPIVEAHFAAERRAIARLSHPHVVSWHDIGDDYLAMRYVRGTDLARTLRGPLPPRVAVRIGLQVASALAHAHERGVVHRDVKPANVLLDVHGNAHLTDFGIATLAAGNEVESSPSSGAGTPTFMAPEQRDGRAVGPAADQYSFGRMLLALLLGRSPSQSLEADVRALWGDVPDELVEVVRTATEWDPANRFPSIDACIAALEGVARRHFPQLDLLPPLRDSSPFAWAGGSHRGLRFAPHIERHDYSLATLESLGLLPADACAAFRASTGYAEIGFSLYGRNDKLGPVNDPAACARATQLVLFVHGFTCTRELWHTVASGVCRDQRDVMVLVPDLYGFGASRVVEPIEPPRATGRAAVFTVTRLAELLGLASIPTLLVGHSMGAAAVLSYRDDELPGTTHRVAITPVFPAHHATFRARIHLLAFVLRTFGRSRRVLAAIADAMMKAPELADYTDAEREYGRKVFLEASPTAQAAFATGFCSVTPAVEGQLARAEILVMLDDPVAKEKPLLRALEELGIPLARVRRLVGGTHAPQWEHREHPEWTARNVNEIVDCLSESLARMRGEEPPGSSPFLREDDAGDELSATRTKTR